MQTMVSDELTPHNEDDIPLLWLSRDEMDEVEVEVQNKLGGGVVSICLGHFLIWRHARMFPSARDQKVRAQRQRS